MNSQRAESVMCRILMSRDQDLFTQNLPIQYVKSESVVICPSAEPIWHGMISDKFLFPVATSVLERDKYIEFFFGLYA